ncbi:HD domain-containing phosphohydrolase [Geminocystis sp. GBBB08]|uniref:HD domain-containing phosphohydrolase n=1 Tax=Geminocystis sp. GBBB08 TaxID=2604140 RepID=UPI0027E23CB0|nr:HD domain-containing phosphohydrolase [Geminocystis sp. GBBB08]MBL1210996.1 response regulator [Geminocystis sp. GBBB08]
MSNYQAITELNPQGRFISVVSTPSKIMVVDDQPLSLLHAVDLISYEGYQVIKSSNSCEVLELAFSQQPDVILMDIVMPERDGLELAKILKLQPQTKSIPIVLMSVVEDLDLWQKALKIGVEEIILKPLNHNSLSPKLKILAQQKRLNEGLDQTKKVLLSLAMAIEARSLNTNKSLLKLANLAMNFAQYLGLSDQNIEDLVLAAYLHDIGTVNISEQILSKKTQLTYAEKEIIHQHVIIGEQICQPLSNQPNLLAIIRHHHEKWDGSGYPDQLVGENIPYLAQIFQMIDIYDALTNERIYKPAYNQEDSLAIMEQEVLKGWRNPVLFAQFKNFILFDTHRLISVGACV